MSLFSGVETEERLLLTLANAMVQKGTTVQCQPLRGRYISHRERHCRQTKAHTLTQLHTTLKHRATLTKLILLKLYFPFLRHTFSRTLGLNHLSYNQNISCTHPQRRPTPIRNTNCAKTQTSTQPSPGLLQSFSHHPTNKQGIPAEPQLICPSPLPAE